MDWTQDIDDVLNSIRINALLLANKHRVRYFELRDSLKWYRYIENSYIGLILGGPAARYRVPPPHAPEAEEPRTQVPGRRGQAHVSLMATVVTPHNAAPKGEAAHRRSPRPRYRCRCRNTLL